MNLKRRIGLPLESPTSMSDRIRTILRRDLKVGAHVQLEDDTPLFGSATDLDSLDALLLISSVEKDLKIKIPNDLIGRDSFSSIRALATFLDSYLKSPDAAARAAAGAVADPLKMLPHGEPFRFVSRLEKLSPGEAGHGVWQLTGNEAFFAGHFPGDPLVPGVLIAEALAQLSGIVAASTAGAGAPVKAGRIAQLDIRYLAAVRPPADIQLESRLTRRIGSICEFEVRASAKTQVAAEGRLTMGMG